MPLPHPRAFPPSTNRVPIRAQLAWSDTRERRLSMLADGVTLTLIAGNILGLGFLSATHELEVLLISIAFGVFCMAKISATSRSMLSNKPVASNYAAECTKWTRWPENASIIECPCGRIHHWADAERFPKAPIKMPHGMTAGDLAPYPAGQARLVMNCPCGRGHYRLVS